MDSKSIKFFDRLLNERLKMQRFTWSKNPWQPNNDFSRVFHIMEELVDEQISLLDDHWYKQVLNVPIEEWQFSNQGN